MRAESQPTGQQMMLNINVWSCIFLGLAITITGEGVAFCDFVSRHPMVLMNLTLLSAASAIGQLFIYVTVSYLKPLHIHKLSFLLKFLKDDIFKINLHVILCIIYRAPSTTNFGFKISDIV